MLVLLTFGGRGGGVVQNRESPDFRSPEVGRYVLVTLIWHRTTVMSCSCFYTTTY